MLMVQTHLAKQCKHVNVMFFFLLLKFIRQQEEKLLTLFSVSKLWLLT